MLRGMGDAWGPPPCPMASRPSRCRGVVQGPCASCGSCTGPCCSSRGLRVPRWGCLLRRGLGELVGEGRKSGSALACMGGFPSFCVGARKAPWDALSCRDMSRRWERPCSSSKSWQSQAWEQSGGGETPRHGDPLPVEAARPLTCSEGCPGYERAAVHRGFIPGRCEWELPAHGVVQGGSFRSLAPGQRGAGKRLLPGHTERSPSPSGTARPRSAAWERPPGTGWLGDRAPVTPPRGWHRHPAFLGDVGAERQGRGLGWGC